MKWQVRHQKQAQKQRRQQRIKRYKYYYDTT
jgi:hypothetical protein